ncbi:MAG: caspase family protein [Bacteroidetes bacterium]|nr:caspase family protein [Bacteroidota bacterium]
MKICTLSFLYGLLFLLVSSPLLAQPVSGERRALVIGINTYNPNEENRARWRNLDGCINDAISIREQLVARYGFSFSSVDTLFNDQASRVSILSHFKKLLDQSQQGDYVVIFFAGHGSQVKNSLSKEADKKDESIVTADSWKGANDIRDKELAVEFNKFIDKGIVLTVIFDCCHSGSLGRGCISALPKFRSCDPIETDVKDDTEVVPPEDRGMLLISAAQDFEFASEQLDDQHNPHGIFTIALLHSMATLPISAPAMEIVNNLRTIIQFNGKMQEPVIAGTSERKKQTLFGIDKALLSNKTLVSVILANDTIVELQGGIAVGIYENSELEGKDKSGNPIHLRVTSVYGLNRCIARVTKGNITSIQPGDLFEVSNWVLPSMSTLKIYLSKSDFSESQLAETAQKFYRLGKSGKIILVNDPVLIPTHTIYYLQGHWYLGRPKGKPLDLGASPLVSTIQQMLPDKARLLVNLPLTKPLYDALCQKFNKNSSVEYMKNPGDAQYILSGRFRDGLIEYAFVMPYLTQDDNSRLSTMPVRTNYFPLQHDLKIILDSLESYSLRLAKVRAWLTLPSPPDDGRFPFRLGVRKLGSKEFMTKGVLKVGDTVDLYLWGEPEKIKDWDMHGRYIYVFSINSSGKMNLRYPRGSSGSVENKLPLINNDGIPVIPKFLRRNKISQPVGVDAYIMVYTDEPIPDPEVFNQPGMLDRSAHSQSTNGMDPYSVLLTIGAKSRGSIVTPSFWNIQRFTITSVP